MLTLSALSGASSRSFHRRDFLRLGAMGLGGLTLTDLLRHEASADRPSRGKSLIYIVLGGGPSHIDTWDLKPQAPEEYRGPFNPIATRLPGARICELMPRQAQIMDQLAILRGIRSVENDHFLSEVYSGLPRSAGRRPAFGSAVSRLIGGDVRGSAAMPAYVSLNRSSTDQFEFEHPYYAGPGHAPFRPFGEALNDLAPAQDPQRLRDRRQLLRAFDSMRRDLHQGDVLSGMDRFQAQALEIITSPRVRDAFDLSKEPDRLRDSYGKGRFPHQTVVNIMYPWNGEQLLLARRLVEAGVRVVTVRIGDWDHHSSESGNIFTCLSHLLPLLDQGIHALVNDLRVRGLDKDVLVVVLGEFGRTPRISYPGPGREHWADAGCAVLVGGGLKMGQVIGEADSRGERPRAGHTTFQSIVATIYHTLGVPLDTQLTDYDGRPQYLLEEREPIRELVE